MVAISDLVFVNRHTFRHVQKSVEHAEETVEVTTESESLSEVISAFEDYLRGCGFQVDGHLDIVEDE